MEDALLRTIARLDGTPFPSTARLASRWLLGRLPTPPAARGRGPAGGPADRSGQGPGRALETAYCAEVVAATYQSMGLLSGERSRSGTTPAGSGAATSWNWWPGPGWAARSPSRSAPLIRPRAGLRRTVIERGPMVSLSSAR